MPRWIPFPFEASAYRYDKASLRQAWGRLHAGDAEPCPVDDDVLAAWVLFHAGDFEGAVDAGLRTTLEILSASEPRYVVSGMRRAGGFRSIGFVDLSIPPA